MARMKLLTKEILKKLPALYSQEQNPDPMVICKFFNPTGAATWYVTEFDGQDTFFGWVDLYGNGEGELGYFSLNELQNYRGRFGLGIERDLHWTPVPLSQVKDGKAR